MSTIIHRYLTTTYTNPQPPGFADFLRGTIALYQISVKHNCKLMIDIESHPIFKFLDIPEEYSVKVNKTLSTIEILPPIEYDKMNNIIETYLQNTCELLILTNAFYDENTSMLNEYNFIKSILRPNILLLEYINSLRKDIKLNDTESYIVIHARVGDDFLVYKKDIQDNLIDKIRNYIKIVVQENNKPVLFIADSYQLKKSVNDLCRITAINPIHTGSLDNTEVDNRLLATLAEFFIMSKASKIYCINFWDGSGYSRICGKIYSIDYQCLQL